MSQPPSRSGRPQSKRKGETARSVATAPSRIQAHQSQRAPDGRTVSRRPVSENDQPATASIEQPLSEVGMPAGGNDPRGSTSGTTSTPGSLRSSSWWPFETDGPPQGPRLTPVTTRPSSNRRRSFRDWLDGRDWQRVADVLLVGALVVTLGITAKMVLDHGSPSTDPGAAEAPSGDRRDDGLAGALQDGDPGSLVTSRVTASGTLIVKQKLVTGDTTSSLTLSNGRAPSGAQGADGTVVRDLTVAVGDREVEPPQTTLQRGESAEVVLDDSASEFLLDYVVDEAVRSSDASGSGRAVVELTTLGAEESTGPKVVRIRAGETGEILSVACGRRLAIAVPCGQEGNKGYSVRLDREDTATRVFASVDLPTS